MEYKTCPVFGVKVLDESRGIVEHIFAVHGVLDSVGDVSYPNSFKRTLAERDHKVRVLDMHQTDSVLRAIGKPLEIREVGRNELPASLLLEHPEATGGVYAKTQFLMDSPEGRGAYLRIANGVISEWSYAYDAILTDRVKVEDRQGKTVSARALLDVSLWEYGPVIWGAQSSTMTISAKSGLRDLERDLEAEKRDLERIAATLAKLR